MRGRSLRIAALEPYAAVSHLAFLEGLRTHSRHDLTLFTLPARYWKWRMRTSSLHFAEVLSSEEPFDLILVSDYLNLAELSAVLPAPHRKTPAVVYFHENQLTYPLQEGEERDVHHAFTHFHSILSASAALFNSHYHRRSFFEALGDLIAKAPDLDMKPSLERASSKSTVLPIGTDLSASGPRTFSSADGPPRILWNHRWEYDKNPQRFLEALVDLDRRGIDFRVRLLGQSFRKRPAGLRPLLERIHHRLDEASFLEDRADYVQALRTSDIVCSTAHHEYFGIGTLEALRSGVMPLLPNDLAYPELLPELDRVERFLYDPAASFSEALESSIEAMVNDRWIDDRETIVAHTDNFHWESLIGEYDRRFEEASGL